MVAIEHDSRWADRLKRSLPPNAEIRLVTDGSSYIAVARDEREPFDIIVIDGLYRYDCSIRAAEYLRPGGMIVLDNADYRLRTTSKKLREQDLIQVDFTGFKPAHDDVQTTSVF